MKEIHFKTINSTNTYAKTLTHSDEILCISADEQTAGHGRHNRKWISPAGVNLLATFCFIETQHLSCLSHLMTTSMTNVLIAEGLSPKIKWPNDIQLNGKKVCGILCEIKNANVFLSAGLNVNMEKRDLEQIDQPATSLKVETGREWDIKSLLKKLQTQFQSDLETFKKEGFAPFHSFFEKHMAHLGQTVEWSDGRTKWQGTCRSLRSDGGLDLELPDGRIHPLYSGELTDYNSVKFG